jgi:hypothetical protein
MPPPRSDLLSENSIPTRLIAEFPETWCWSPDKQLGQRARVPTRKKKKSSLLACCSSSFHIVVSLVLNSPSPPMCAGMRKSVRWCCLVASG